MFLEEEHKSLTLGLGFQSSTHLNLKPTLHYDHPSLTLSLSAETCYPMKKSEEEQPACSVTSLSNTLASVSVKREREIASSDEDRASSRASDDEEDDTVPVATRKKLRLTKDQSALLEDTFKQHTALNPKQKQALADRLSLRPRQVEVWFQNRRARTKLKQTEFDCEYLKKCCATLTDENRRLQKEVEELKAMKMGQPSFYMHVPPPTLTMCPSCERIGALPSPTPFSVSVPNPHFYAAFPSPSAAC